jgi:prevent-host-death family protein
MMEIGAYEAKTHLGQLLKRVSKGERITMTRHGVAVAVLQPPDYDAGKDPGKAIRGLRQLREGKKLSGLSLRDLLAEGRS